MKRLLEYGPSRAMSILLLAVLVSGAAPAPVATMADPEHLIVLSTTDVKGKTSPCGCHTPKGGLARRAAYIDSMRAEHGQMIVVDAGGFFPEVELQKDAGPFTLRLMKQLGTDAAGVGERDLRFGYAFLRDNAKAAGMPLLCANLYDKASGRPAFAPSLIKKVGNVTVGVFGVITAKADLGPGRDSLRVEDPLPAAARAVEDLRKRGATVIVMLSQLGKIEGEDLAASVDGIDAVILGRDVTLVERGRLIKHTIAAYGGDQGWYVGLTKLTLDAKHAVVSSENEMSMLGPEVPTDEKVLTQVKAFEDQLNERLRAHEHEEAVRQNLAVADDAEDQPDHYIGAELCARCHSKEYTQWQGTPHAHAWATLVAQKKDATPECVKCHVLGYQKVGGFRTGDDAPRLANVQCESCHGMGTQHESMKSALAPVSELTCRGCHDGTSSPTFDFAVYRPHILHTPPADLKPLPESPAKKLMRMQGNKGTN